ncbi:hypothetical protein [Metapseudomonas furukawaii]|jgi:hypothetical protein|uniref:Uncharacterized protein n=1 Tax=Metapseudomonas furukawaii TaxID=1149133 RepID=A0AAD1C1Y7_METFU|nr:MULTISPECIES: hypothetical protein [Pseudomonas]ELS26279.1 hypothetical protein ppKF707_6071 [Pseudomonas furukawaii]WAG77767.1 hypothetical protein LMK08_20750 [Pseudomonas furukawaii]BAU75886.1 hypothetical protein KF707C_41980 [Pseudomonas furukawaii]
MKANDLASLPPTQPGAALAYLRGRVLLKRLRACVSAKQNGFWQIVR